MDEVNVGTALRLLGRSSGEKPYATCPRDGEPLISTIEQPGAEFLCMVCGVWYGFLSPKPATPTPELEARYNELQTRFDAGERPHD